MSDINPMQMLAQMRMQGQAPQPIGPNQGVGGPQPGAPPDMSGPSGPTPIGQQGPTESEPGTQPNPLTDLANQIHGKNKEQHLAKMLKELQKLYPKLLLAEHANGHAQMKGSAQDQFLGAAWARMKGAKVAHVRNNGKGQRLHLEWPDR